VTSYSIAKVARESTYAPEEIAARRHHRFAHPACSAAFFSPSQSARPTQRRAVRHRARNRPWRFRSTSIFDPRYGLASRLCARLALEAAEEADYS